MWRGALILCLLVVSTPVHAYPVGPAIPLEELATKVELIAKGTVLSVKPVTDPSFVPVTAYPVYEAELAVISTFKGKPATKLRFRHYTYKPANVGIGYSPLAYDLVPGRTYVVFAIRGSNGSFRQFQKDHTQKASQGVIPAGDTKPHRGATITEVAWEELRTLAKDPVAELAREGIDELDALSGGHMTKLADFDRGVTLAELRPLVLAKDDQIARAAITVFGTDGPYFVDRDAPYWLAGIGKGTISGLTPRKPTTLPGAVIATKELLDVATTRPALRAIAIRALGRTKTVPASSLIAWSKDPDLEVRRAAVLVSAESTDRTLIRQAAVDPLPELRATAALAIGFTQDPRLLAVLGPLHRDPKGPVRAAAAMSLLSFAITDATPSLVANLGTDFGPLFVNALATHDPKPYLARLADVIVKNQQPGDWWGGSIPSGVSWKLLFGYLKAQPIAELTKQASLLDALEKLKNEAPKPTPRICTLSILRTRSYSKRKPFLPPKGKGSSLRSLKLEPSRLRTPSSIETISSVCMVLRNTKSLRFSPAEDSGCMAWPSRMPE